jgi:hypothetical protein
MSPSKNLVWFARALLVPASVIVVLSNHGLVTSATKDSQSQDVEGVVKEALHRELYGLQADRQRLLDEAAKRAPDYAPAQWHRGYVRMGAEWQSVDALIQNDQLSNIEKEYQLRRSKLEDTVDGNLKLANWCRERSLPQQERAHLSRILELNSEQPGIRGRLGLQNLNGQWVTKDEAREAAERLGKEAEALSRWRSELREIGRGLRHESPDRQQAARERLAAIQDPYALAAMETLLSPTSEECALAVVDVVSRVPGQEAVDSLIRHAVFSQWPLVREAAADKLRVRPRESFVPDMISEMYMPMTSQFEWTQLPNGRFGYRHLIQREGAEEREVLVLDTEYSRNVRPGANGRETLQRAFLDSVLGMAQRETTISQRNAAQSAVNQRLTEALNIATNQQLLVDPQKWWQWWDQENYVSRQGDKQTRVRQQVRQVSVSDRRPQLAGGLQASSSQGRQARVECFAAGTKVFTRHGPAPIEKILVGDLVLSQHPDTGELAFKPVIGTTVRPAEKLVKVTVGRDTFETSQGHLYWVAGQGWCKAQRLDSGMQLHCLRGSESVSSVEEGTEGATYNLNVADFHTYFVGESRVLSHDVTNRRPTESIVPGLKVND